MKTKIVVSRNELLAALLFASKDETRHIIQGVQIEVQPGRKPSMIATDGRRLAVINTIAEQEQEFDSVSSVIMRPEMVKLFCSFVKAVGGKNFPWLTMEYDPDILIDREVTIGAIGMHHRIYIKSGAFIEGEYPDWRKVMPPKRAPRTAISEVALNAEFVGDFAKASLLLNKDHGPTIQMLLVGSENQIEVRLTAAQQFYGLLMQCKLDEEVDYQPEFTTIVAGAEKAQLKIDADLAAAIQKAMDENIGKGQVTVKAGNADSDEDVDDEDMFEQCIEVIRSEQKATVSLLQRRLRLGYARASKIMDELERRGIVGPSKGAEPRDILINTAKGKAKA